MPKCDKGYGVQAKSVFIGILQDEWLWHLVSMSGDGDNGIFFMSRDGIIATHMSRDGDNDMMKAVLIDKITTGKDVVLSDIAVPEVKPGWMLIHIRAFDMNHSEEILRLSEVRADYNKKAVIPGTERIGVIVVSSDNSLSARPTVKRRHHGFNQR